MSEAARRDEVLAEIESLDLTGHLEDAVREEIVIKLLNLLGYRRGGGAAAISTPLNLQYVKTGREKRTTSKKPDYVLTVDGRSAIVVEAKPPRDPVDFGSAEQCLSYAIHPKVQALLGVVINGNELAVYLGSLSPEAREPRLRLPRSEWRRRWSEIEELLHPGSVRSGLLEKGSELMGQALPLGTSMEAVVRVAAGAETLIEVHSRDGQPVKVRLEARTAAGDAALDSLRTGGPTELSAADFNVSVGEERINLNDHWGPMFQSFVYQESRPVDVLLLAPDGPVGFRLKTQLRQVEFGHWVLGDEHSPVTLDIGDGRTKWTFDPSGQPLLLGLRIAELMQALAMQGELVLVDAKTMNVQGGMRGTFDCAPDPRLVGSLRRLVYVCLKCRINDMKLPDEITEADETNIETIYRLLKGEAVRVAGRSESAPPDVIPIADYQLSAVGQTFSLGAASIEVTPIERHDDHLTWTGFLSLVRK